MASRRPAAAAPAAQPAGLAQQRLPLGGVPVNNGAQQLLASKAQPRSSSGFGDDASLGLALPPRAWGGCWRARPSSTIPAAPAAGP